MNDAMFFQLMKFIRNRTLATIDGTPEHLAMEIPEGFNNHLLWHYGHIFVSHELLLYSFVKEEHSLPPHYIELFNRGSNPREWKHGPPSLLELRAKLEEQPQRTIDTFSGRLKEKGEKPYAFGPDTQLTTLGEVLGFANWHEGLHQGTSDGIKRALGLKGIWKK